MKQANLTLSSADIEVIRQRVLKAIAPLKPADKARRYKNVGSTRTKAGRNLPPYYLVYFLLVELLDFPHSGRWEKVAWSIPTDFAGNFAMIEHRKLGLGIFSAATAEDEAVAENIVKAIKKGIGAAAPFFDHMAAEAASRSKLNVTNNSDWLFQRYEWLRDQFRAKVSKAEARKNDVKVSRHGSAVGYSFPSFELRQQAEWLGIAAIEAFFSWTEHVLILIAILQGKLTTGVDVATLAQADWSEKIKAAIDLSQNPNLKSLYEELLEIRRQVRNFMAHGAFGKNGEAFQFHSGAGAVPLNVPDPDDSKKFLISGHPTFREEAALQTAEAFIEALWRGDLEPAKMYLQDAALPIILTYASNGVYGHAMSSTEEMATFIDGLTREMDDAANMDW